ncbi:serine hydrolase [Paenibacillus sp. JCM 10914]|uniref:serine hydrolase domain-containing protein n=1 Tax=Paenibacillus sp. JCM 10914 TaxID=1236974 RepID=UPI001E57F7E2|nr:serine hydrolase domain-containing protein [Paenibacillus sp. JCM 10914]
MSIENAFRKQVQTDSKLRSAYLLIHSEKLGIHLNIAEGSKNHGTSAYPQQPNYMASVGKIFTSVLVAILVEQGTLSFDDPIADYLDTLLLEKLHIYKDTDYTHEINIRHLLNQTSGLFDNFWPLLDKLIANPAFDISPREAIIWGKEHLTSHFPPGKGFKYTDTNYHLLGLIIESVTNSPFHVALKQYIFEPVGMLHSSMLHYSDSMAPCPYPMADFYFRGHKLNEYKGYAGLDYAGGGVVAPNEDLLKFMKSLVNHTLLTRATIEQMMSDRAKYGIGIDYGYGVMQFITVPLLMPKVFNAWGHAGATGAFMFYHPQTEAYLIGTFNDASYERKGVRFMMKTIHKLSKCVVAE